MYPYLHLELPFSFFTTLNLRDVKNIFVFWTEAPIKLLYSIKAVILYSLSVIRL